MKAVFFSMLVVLGLLMGRTAPAATTATNEPAGTLLLDGIAAQVNNQSITLSEVMSEVSSSAWIELPKEAQEKRVRELYNETLNAMVNRKLILDAAKSEERKLQPWVVDSRVQEIIDTRFAGDNAKLLAALTERHMTRDEWRKGIEDDMMLAAMRMEFVDKRVSVSPRDIRGYYETNRQAFATTPQTRVGIITLAVGKEDETLPQLGDRVLKELDDGADFAAAAKAFSRDSRAGKGGDWGMVNPDEQFAPPIAHAIAALKPGQHSRLIVIGEQGYIAKKTAEEPARALSLEEAWPLIERRLRRQQSEDLYRAWIDRLRKQSYVRTFDLPPSMR